MPLLTRGTTQRRFDVLRTAAELSYRVLLVAHRPCLHASIHSKSCFEANADENTQRPGSGAEQEKQLFIKLKSFCLAPAQGSTARQPCWEPSCAKRCPAP